MDALEKEEISTELQREVKWLKMLKKWNKKETKEKLQKRIFKGIPSKLRSCVSDFAATYKIAFINEC
jgi:hypothetical protein